MKYVRQDEDDSEKDLIEAERAYFVARDHDGDGGLNKEEFIRQLNDVDIFDEEVEEQHESPEQMSPHVATNPKAGRTSVCANPSFSRRERLIRC